MADLVRINKWVLSLLNYAVDIKAERDLYGWRLYSGRRSIECKSESEAQYLKVWLEAGLTEIKVPRDEEYLRKIVPELVAEKKKTDKTINSYLDSILDIKLRNRILHQLWHRLTKESLSDDSEIGLNIGEERI